MKGFDTEWETHGGHEVLVGRSNTARGNESALFSKDSCGRQRGVRLESNEPVEERASAAVSRSHEGFKQARAGFPGLLVGGDWPANLIPHAIRIYVSIKGL